MNLFPEPRGEVSPETFEARWTSGSIGPAVGASFKGHVKRNGVGPTYWAPCQITKCVPGEVFEFNVGSDTMTVNTWGYRLEPDGEGTTLERMQKVVEGNNGG